MKEMAKFVLNFRVFKSIVDTLKVTKNVRKIENSVC
jgi:hypothetical protein